MGDGGDGGGPDVVLNDTERREVRRKDDQCSGAPGLLGESKRGGERGVPDTSSLPTGGLLII